MLCQTRGTQNDWAQCLALHRMFRVQFRKSPRTYLWRAGDLECEAGGVGRLASRAGSAKLNGVSELTRGSRCSRLRRHHPRTDAERYGKGDRVPTDQSHRRCGPRYRRDLKYSSPPPKKRSWRGLQWGARFSALSFRSPTDSIARSRV